MDKSKKDESSNDNIVDSDDKYRMYASLAFMAVVIVIGVPMWWKTTEVYRVSLPSTSILELSETSLKTAITVGIFTFEPMRSALLIQELSEAFKENDVWNIKFEQITQIDKAATVKTPVGLEAAILRKYSVRPGDFMFIEWPKLTDEILFTNERSALFKSDTSAVKIQNALNITVLQTFKIQSILHEDKRYATKSSAPQPQYDVIVSVLNPRPDIMNVKWNVQLATETYIAPFLQEVNLISNFTLKTQWKYQVPFEFELKQIRDETKLSRHYALPEATLPHIITSVEKNLGVGITDNSAINMIVYIPPCDIAPLHIYNRNGEKATRNKVDSFVSPKWGGIIIYNPPFEACLAYNENLEKVSFYVNTNDVMQVMLFHLHKLLDIHVDVPIEGVKFVDIDQIAPRKWEYEAFIRRSVLSHIVTASHTLQSLIHLLDDINYIVINDDVGRAINEAYNNILEAKAFLESNDMINASIHAKSAFLSSEKAFFEPSLLAQLYFPDEQKYAIYIPLFLPIVVPVLTSISMIKKFNTGKIKAD